MRKILFPLGALWLLGVGCPLPPVEGAWSEQRIDEAGTLDLVDSHSTRMCVAPNGDTFVVWIDDRDGQSDLWFNRKLAHDERDVGWFDTPVRVNAFPGSNLWKPAIACTDTGVYVVWEDDRDGEVESHQIYVQRSVDGGQTWMAEDRLLEEDLDGRSNSFDPDIVAEGPNVYVAWSDNVNGAFDILFARSTDSGVTWQDPVRIDSDEPPGSAYSAFPRLATGFGGDHVYVTWQDFRNGGTTVDGSSDVYFARSTDKGQSFGADQRLDTGDDPGATDSFVPQVAADDDDVYVVWHDARYGEANDILMNHSSDGGVTWLPTARVGDALGTRGLDQSLYPKLCVADGTAHVVWYDAIDQGFFRVYYNRAVDGAWLGEQRRLDANKESGQRGSVHPVITCDGDHVAAAWIDHVGDVNDDGYGDLAFNYSADGGDTWRTPTDTGAASGTPTYRIDSLREDDFSYKDDVTVHLQGGRLRAAWTDGRAGSSDVYFQQLDAADSKPLPSVAGAGD